MSPRTLISAVILAMSGALALPATPAFSAPASSAPTAEILGADRPGAIAGSYIVTLKDTATLRSRGVPGTTGDLAKRYGGTIGHVYTAALNGFSVKLGEAAAKRLAADPAVARVEADGRAHIAGSQSPADWGLDRTDQRALPLNNAYTYTQTGAGVHAYIIDTGMRNNHGQFDGRWSVGVDTVPGSGQNGLDCNGHGTHVAGTVGGTTWGMAKAVTLHAVRVLNCDGGADWSWVIAGVDWVTANAIKPAVANMSLGGEANATLDAAVAKSINSGVSYAIAAGNANVDACTVSPARVAGANTVGATDITDARASFSNFGTCTDIFAPGVNIESDTWFTTPASQKLSGTSMASPHVAGAIALYLQANPTASPAQVTTAMVNAATAGAVTNPGAGSPNRLLYTQGWAAPGGPPPPTASFTNSCNNTTFACSFDGSASSDSNGTITKWSWDFGDGTTGTGKTISHTYSKGAVYSVTLTVTDNNGDTGTSGKSFRVGPNKPPTASFTDSCITYTTIPQMNCFLYGSGSTDSDGTITKWSWTFGDGATSTSTTNSSVYHSYVDHGPYTVTLTVTDNEGATASVTRSVTKP